MVPHYKYSLLQGFKCCISWDYYYYYCTCCLLFKKIYILLQKITDIPTRNDLQALVLTALFYKGILQCCQTVKLSQSLMDMTNKQSVRLFALDYITYNNTNTKFIFTR